MNSSPLVVAGVLTPAQAAAIRQEMDVAAYQPAWVTGGTTGQATVDPATRSTRVVAVSEQTRRLVGIRLEEVRPLLEDHFGVRLGAPEAPEFLLYVMGDKFTLHADRNDQSHSGRRVAVSLFIATDAWGEDALRLYDRDPRTSGEVAYTPIMPDPGSIVAFSADTFHEVVPVPANRYTAVTWFHA